MVFFKMILKLYAFPSQKYIYKNTRFYTFQTVYNLTLNLNICVTL